VEREKGEESYNSRQIRHLPRICTKEIWETALEWAKTTKAYHYCKKKKTTKIVSRFRSQGIFNSYMKLNRRLSIMYTL
jgi:hypothetical protein